MAGKVYKQCAGKGCRSSPRCAHPWYLTFSHNGKRHRVNVDLFAKLPAVAKQEAKKTWLPKFVQAVMESRWPEPERTVTEPTTFGSLVELYIKRYCEPQGLNLDSDKSRLAILKKRFGPLLLIELERPGPIEDFRADLLQKGCKPSTVNRYMARLRAMLNWAIGRELMTRNPISGRTGLHQLRETGHRVRRLAEDEEERLLSGADPMMQARIVAALDTGMRLGEILKMRNSHIVWESGVMRVIAPNAKSRRERAIPIATVRLREFLEQRRFLGDEAFVFGSVDGGPPKGCRAAWEAVLLTARITDRENGIDGDLHFHDLRHECGSRLAEGKVPLHEIQALLGHASITTTQRYLNATLESLKRSMSVLEGRSSNGHPTPSTEEKGDAQKIA